MELMQLTGTAGALQRALADPRTLSRACALLRDAFDAAVNDGGKQTPAHYLAGAYNSATNAIAARFRDDNEQRRHALSRITYDFDHALNALARNA